MPVEFVRADQPERHDGVTVPGGQLDEAVALLPLQFVFHAGRLHGLVGPAGENHEILAGFHQRAANFRVAHHRAPLQDKIAHAGIGEQEFVPQSPGKPFQLTRHQRPDDPAVQGEQGVVADKQAGPLGDIRGTQHQRVKQPLDQPVVQLQLDPGGRLHGKRCFDMAGERFLLAQRVVFLAEYGHGRQQSTIGPGAGHYSRWPRALTGAPAGNWRN